MTNIGTVFKSNSTKAMLLGSGELGREVAIELKRLGLEVIAVDKYADAPAMQIADRSYVISMLDADALERVILKENPAYIIPEVEAIATQKLVELEERGFNVIPTAKGVNFTMNREGIRTLAAETLGMKTSPYAFARSKDEFLAAVRKIGIPCVVKPIMSSSGHGQSTIRDESQIEAAWECSQTGGRAGGGEVIVEGFVDFDYEITLLTVRHSGGTSFCAPIGHEQVSGDYRRSWQPQPMSQSALEKAKDYAKKITDALGGYGIFGVEMFVKGDEVLFSEVSPRPHDTGMVTMANIELYAPSASRAVVVEGDTQMLEYCNIDKVLSRPNTDMRIFGKPCVSGGHRRMAVLLAKGDTIAQADATTAEMLSDLTIKRE